MEYSVGSLADLISGKNTPNKPKVVKKTFTPTRVDNNDYEEVKIKTPKGKKSLSPKKEKNSNKKKKNVKKTQENDENEDIPEIKPKKAKKPKIKQPEDTSEVPETPKTKKNLKRKAEDAEESPSKPKKTRSEKNANRRVLNKERQLSKENPEDRARTLYVGNIPLDNNLDKTKKKVKQHFRKYGIIESIRFRGVPVPDPKTTKRIAAIKSQFNPNSKTIYGFVKFVNEEDAVKAQEENSKEFHGHHLRVHILSSEDKPDESKAIFIGNLAFDVIEDDIWTVFEPCGEIDNIRIIRDGKTGMGKGFGYVNFINADSVQLALEMENVKIKNREVRISMCNLSKAKKLRKKNKPTSVGKDGKPRNKFFRFNKGKGKQNGENGDKTNSEAKPFQGSKFSDKNKKKKINKGDLQKKKLIKKIASKTK